MSGVSIKYKIVIPVFLVLVFSIAITSGVNTYQSYTNAKEQVVKLAFASIKPIVLTSEVAVSGANIMKLKSKDMQTLYSASEALFIKVDGMSNKIPKSAFFAEQPPKKMNYTYKSKNFKPLHEELIKKSKFDEEQYLFVGKYLLVKNKLKINNGGTVISLFDASQVSELLTNIIKKTLYVSIPLVIISGLLILYISSIFIGNVKILRDGLDSFFKFLNDEASDAQMISVKSNDEIGNMTSMINENITKIKKNIEADNEMIAEVTSLANKMKIGHLSNRLKHNANNKALQDLKTVLNDMLDHLQENISHIMQTLDSYAKHDYKSRVDTNGLEGSVLRLSTDINSVGNSVVEMLQESKKNGLILEQNSDELSKSVDSLSSSATQQAASLEETAASLEQITGNIKNNTESIIHMAENGKELQSSVSSGNKLAQDTVVAMEEINEQTNAITEAITVIDQIAFQTNILSLNAAVEAATAGEAGKGFAVVAQEVRNLAARSAEAAKEIKDIVEKAHLKTSSGKEIASQMINGYDALNENIASTIELINKAATSSKEQEEGIVQINEAINSIDKITQQNASTAGDTKVIAKQTKDISHIIVQSVDSKEFGGSDDIHIRKTLIDTKYKGKERRKIERELKTAQPIIQKTQKSYEDNSKKEEDEWESF